MKISRWHVLFIGLLTYHFMLFEFLSDSNKKKTRTKTKKTERRQKKGALGAFYFVEAATEDSRGLGLTNEGIGVDVFYYF